MSTTRAARRALRDGNGETPIRHEARMCHGESELKRQ
jgi:hypothetical protein